jgi:D-alanine-D-alanine ligase
VTKRLPDSVLILHNEPESKGPGRESVEGVLDQVCAVEKALHALGVKVERAGVRNLPEAGKVITRTSAPVVFNLVEAFSSGQGDAELIPALCRTFEKGVTGNDTPALLLTLDKWRTKSVLQDAGIPTPPARLVLPGQKLPVNSLPASPWIVKPVSADASEGITCASIITDSHLPALRRQVANIHKTFQQAALVESCVGNREINVSLIQEEGVLKILPLAEIDFSRLRANEPHIVDYEAKWKPSSRRYKATRRVIPAALSPSMASRIREIARNAWHATGCRHYARVDLRVDGGSAIYVLEVNANPDISPDAGFVAALEASGVSFANFVGGLVSDAWTAMTRPVASRRQRRSKNVTVSVRPSRVDDRSAVEALLQQPVFFKPHEIVVGLEVLDEAHEGGESGHYQSYVSIGKGGRVTGWICYGATPCAEGTYDIYWIVVAPDLQGQGIGGALVRYAEARMLDQAGRMSLLETSGRPDYEPTRRFYLKTGYTEVSRIRDFYSRGDDRVTYSKRLD